MCEHVSMNAIISPERERESQSDSSLFSIYCCRRSVSAEADGGQERVGEKEEYKLNHSPIHSRQVLSDHTLSHESESGNSCICVFVCMWCSFVLRKGRQRQKKTLTNARVNTHSMRA